ncbi:helix-turn-helix domain-containing protein [Amphritea pacifica]|uniref:Helix-turn-helix domain-containing protein n=1 Tax=Amphritea pacifica TaxID=2811233 RepID=A0ABS2WBV2_9GAMM|nr:helix-turn-helix domain-containing protein [Amphritea pacifica]MBN0989096.1 helix-turn-helix domain-containing protein [Amphritea pacifica]
MSELNNHHQIPITDFYGESTSWPVEDMVHSEQLSLRSALNNWQIKPHRHKDLMQLFFVLCGQGSAQVDNRSLTLKAGDLLVIPEQCVHKFHWESGSDGFVIAVASPLLKQIEKLLDAPSWTHGAATLLSAGEHQLYLTSLLSSINEEYAGAESYRQLLLENRLLTLAIWITRQSTRLNEAIAKPKSRSEQHLKRFTDLLESNFNKQHSVDWYAEHVGVTSAHLNEICKKLRHQTALSLIHQRLLTEAQRTLIFTVKPASDISHQLGFSDPAYFSRFFKRLCGVTPKQFRQSKLKD